MVWDGIRFSIESLSVFRIQHLILETEQKIIRLNRNRFEWLLRFLLQFNIFVFFLCVLNTTDLRFLIEITIRKWMHSIAKQLLMHNACIMNIILLYEMRMAKMKFLYLRMAHKAKQKTNVVSSLRFCHHNNHFQIKNKLINQAISSM